MRGLYAVTVVVLFFNLGAQSSAAQEKDVGFLSRVFKDDKSTATRTGRSASSFPAT